MKLIKGSVEACFLYVNGYLSTLGDERLAQLIKSSLFERLVVVLKTTLKELFLIIRGESKPTICKGQNIAVVSSNNNVKALSFLNSPEITFVKFTSLGRPIDGAIRYQVRYKFFFSLLFILLLPYILMKKTNREILILLHKSFGLSVIYRSVLKHLQPKSLLFTNDHTPEMRSLLLAAKSLGIHCSYIQHAAVSKFFPPLIFDRAYLDSQQSFDIYKEIGIEYSCAVSLIGISRLQTAYGNRRKRNEIRIVGIAVNQNDDLGILANMTSTICETFDKVLVRMHPADKRRLKLDPRVSFDTGSLLNFIETIDFLIAADSSIHLECNSLWCRSVYYRLHHNHEVYDYYGFVRQGLIDEVTSFSNLINYIRKFDYRCCDFESFEYFNAALKDGYKTDNREKVLSFINLE